MNFISHRTPAELEYLKKSRSVPQTSKSLALFLTDPWSLVLFFSLNVLYFLLINTHLTSLYNVQRREKGL